jgi:acyl-coenzyme A synthetase/AMP-(fatty) acid ligase
MKANSVTIDRSSTPSRIDFSPSFNLCGLFCDRHLAEGRGAKVLARGRTWTLSFGEMHKSVCRFANALKSLGVQPGDRVMLLAKDTPAFYIAFLGAIRMGAVVIPTNTFLRSSDYAYMMTDSKAVAVIAADGPIDEVVSALDDSGGSVKHRIAIDGSRAGWLTLKELIAGA